MYELGAKLVQQNTLVQVISGLKFRCDVFASPPKIHSGPLSILFTFENLFAHAGMFLSFTVWERKF